MTSKQTVLEFTDRINAHDVDGLAALMSDGHTFIDAHGRKITGKVQMAVAWKAYFDSFPDYLIEVNEIFESGDSVALIGFASGSFQNKRTERWRLPAAWKAIAKDSRVTLWQVFADTKIPFEIIERNTR